MCVMMPLLRQAAGLQGQLPLSDVKCTLGALSYRGGPFGYVIVHGSSLLSFNFFHI